MATAGPNSPSSNLTNGWTNPGNIYSSNDVWASNLISAQFSGSYITAYGYGFAIAAGSTINGITVAIERHASTTNVIRDNEVYLTLNGGTAFNHTGNNKATGTFWPTTDAVATYGSSSDMWGTTFTDTDVNSSTFGVYLTAYNNDASVNRTAYIDYISVTIDYTLVTGQPMQARSRLVPYTRGFSNMGW